MQVAANVELDALRLREALALAEQAIGRCEPNPRVGCVIGRGDGPVLARGATQRAGAAHAEAAALQQAREQGLDVRDATAWVSLEPCSHHGRTPPCCDALIAAGLARVVVAVGDPNPLVAGQGMARLRAAGMQVDFGPADIERAARELNIGFFSRMQRGRPWLRMKLAASLDGRTALTNGVSQWITSEDSRRDGHAWRKRAGAVLTGIGTVLEDDPRLDVRLVPTEAQPLRVVVDSALQTPTAARVLPAPGSVRIYAAQPQPTRQAALQAAGVNVVLLPNAQGKVDLAAMLADLATQGINELHIEAGHKLNGSFLRAGLVDELLVYLAPLMLGAGREMAAFGPLAALSEGLPFEFTSIERIGRDVRLLARRVSSP